MRTIILIDIYDTGHHQTYLNIYSKTLLELGCRIITLSPVPDILKKWINYNCKEYSKNYFCFKINELKRSIFFKIKIRKFINTLIEIKEWFNLARKIDKILKENNFKIDFAFFLYIDNFLSNKVLPYLIDLIFPFKWTALFFDASQIRELNKRKLFLNKIKYFIKSKNCFAVNILDENIKKNFENLINKKVFILPDFIDKISPDKNYKIAKEIKHNAKGRIIIGQLGEISLRKGSFYLADLLTYVDKKKYYIVFAGTLAKNLSEEEIRNFKIKTDNNNCYCHLKRIEDESKFNAIVNICDILFLTYINFPNSSNLLAKAAFFKKLAIVSNGYLMGERLNKYKLGFCVEQNSDNEIINILNQITKSKYKKLIAKAKFNEFQKIHSVENLKKQIEIIINLS